MRLRAGQVLAGQVAAVAIVVAAVGPTWVLVGVTVAAAAVFVAAFGRVGGRWWFEIILGHLRLLWRRRRAAARVVDALVAGEERPQLWLRALAPGLRIRAVNHTGGGEVGVGSDDDGWFAVVAVDDAQAVEVVPGPLSLGVSCVQVGPRWIAVRLTRSDALAVAGRPGLAVAAAAHRVAELYGARVLDAGGVTAMLTDSLVVGEPPQEHWWGWQTGPVAHVSYRVDSYRVDSYLVDSYRVDRALELPVRAQVRTYTADDRSPAVLVRVVAPVSGIDAACAEMERAAAAADVGLRRLDGDHAYAAYAGAPTGVPAQRFSGRPAAPRPGA